MKVGSMVYATDQGLGILAKSFFDNGILTEVCVVRHGRRPEHDEWYPSSPRLYSLSKAVERAYEMCASVDVMLFFETPFLWELIPFCREVKTKTILMPMYECMPTRWPYQPDLVLNPSHLDQRYFPDGVHLPVPVSVPWKKREKAEVFVHNAGHGGLRGRNGTKEVMEAWQYVKTPSRLHVRGQVQNMSEPLDPRVSYTVENLPYNELFTRGDVFLFPEKFNGLSLPLQEARASGMLVMGGRRFPITEWLPNEPLIPPEGYVSGRISGRCNTFEEAVYNPKTIAQWVDRYYLTDISGYSESGREWAEAMSWEVLGPKYKQLLMELVEK